MRGNSGYPRERHKPDPSWKPDEANSDTLEFIPTHLMHGPLNDNKAQMVMELGRTATGLVFIQYDDGSRGKVNPESLRAIPDFLVMR